MAAAAGLMNEPAPEVLIGSRLSLRPGLQTVTRDGPVSNIADPPSQVARLSTNRSRNRLADPCEVTTCATRTRVADCERYTRRRVGKVPTGGYIYEPTRPDSDLPYKYPVERIKTE
eukprot:GHVU01030553.1.p1 GENE.GHVU01030553.1~~GHVU01030553.1.p1  ORF type:complete len:116 (+),score=2.08 GHVU01030553.1:180-527(+)